MGRTLQRLSTSEPDPESLERSGQASRRYELTPLFWGVVSVIGLALLTALLVVTSVDISAGDSRAAILEKISTALDSGGMCVVSNQGPFRGFLVDGITWNPLPGQGEPTIGGLLQAAMKPKSLVNVINSNRRLSEEIVSGPSICTFSSRSECEAPGLQPYYLLIYSMYSYFQVRDDNENFITSCGITTSFTRTMGDFDMEPICSYLQTSLSLFIQTVDNPQSRSGSQQIDEFANSLFPCYEIGESKCVFWIDQANMLKQLYPTPCSWDSTTNIGKLLARLVSFTASSLQYTTN